MARADSQRWRWRVISVCPMSGSLRRQRTHQRGSERGSTGGRMPRTRLAPGAEPRPPRPKPTAALVRRRPASEPRGWAAECGLEWRATVPSPKLDWLRLPRERPVDIWLAAETPLGVWRVDVMKFEAVAVCELREAG